MQLCEPPPDGSSSLRLSSPAAASHPPRHCSHARLDTADTQALRSFPELITAAEQALEAGTGFARDWKSDTEDVDAVARARQL